jgi:hypothetical protein
MAACKGSEPRRRGSLFFCVLDGFDPVSYSSGPIVPSRIQMTTKESL